MGPYDDALMSEEGTRRRRAVHDAIDDYVQFFESRALQIKPSWVRKAQMETSFPDCGLEEKPIEAVYEAIKAITDAARTNLPRRNGWVEIAEAFKRLAQQKVVTPMPAA